MALFAAACLAIAINSARVKRKTGYDPGWFWPGLMGVLFGLTVMILNLRGAVFHGV
jgi:hypothetical protein